MTDKYTLQIPADLQQLARVRRFIQDAGTALGACKESVEDLALAIDEAVTNTIVHGYRGGRGTIAIKVRRSGDAVTVQLRDNAPVFDPTLVSDPDLDIPLEQRPLGGMGIYLMKNNVDELKYRAIEPGGNELTLVKKIE